jgi:hypothetical protein
MSDTQQATDPVTDPVPDALVQDVIDWIGAELGRLDDGIRALEQRPAQDDAAAEVAAVNAIQALRTARERGEILRDGLEEVTPLGRLVQAIGQDGVDAMLTEMEARLKARAEEDRLKAAREGG